MRKYRLHWSIHPEKDQTWYERESARMTPDEIARELDINYSMSVSGKVFSSFNEMKHVTKKFEVNPHRPVYRIWDFGRCNAVLYAQIDEHGRKRLLHERILEGSDTYEQMHIAIEDCKQLFPENDFEDICDPSGSWSKDGATSAQIDVLRAEGIYPSYDRILHERSTRERKRRGREMISTDMQKAPGGQEALLIYADRDNGKGCVELVKAMLGGYAYKKDYAGNITDKIEESHPYEDVVDCLIYLYLETDGGAMTNIPEELYRPTYSREYSSPYLDF